MVSKFTTTHRTHNCGELTDKNIGEEATLCGWVKTRRDHGGIIFIDLRDRFGLTQLVFEPENKELFEIADKLRREFVVKAKGKIRARPKDMENKKLITGKIEVLCNDLDIINESRTPPMEIEDKTTASEDLRLEYRFLDLRRSLMQKHLQIRHKAAQALREYLSEQGFLEIETPLLVRSTPEGARDYVVPSRVNKGNFYALPQSPQLYKQILMVSGVDRYFQMPRCLRDEDLRQDRQPEFTQIDIEMSFVGEEDIFKLIEGLMKHTFKQTLGVNIKTPFKRITFEEAIERYGSDKPDLRFGLELIDVTDIAKESDFTTFRDIAKHEGVVKCINPESNLTRKEIDELIEFAKENKAKGMAWMKVTKDGLDSNIVKYFSPELQKEIIERTNAKSDSILFFIADKPKITNEVLAKLRDELAKRLGLIDEKEFKFCWITDFPIFEWDEDEERFKPVHHIFTSPKDEDIRYLEKNPEKVKGKLYDLTLNGSELFSGSIRINTKDIQEKVLKVIGMNYEEARMKFGFLLKAFQYGAPIHGGIAGGFDRIVSLMCGTKDIREVIAFPKNKAAQSPMDGCPTPLDEKQLKELGIEIKNENR